MMANVKLEPCDAIPDSTCGIGDELKVERAVTSNLIKLENSAFEPESIPESPCGTGYNINIKGGASSNVIKFEKSSFGLENTCGVAGQYDADIKIEETITVDLVRRMKNEEYAPEDTTHKTYLSAPGYNISSADQFSCPSLKNEITGEYNISKNISVSGIHDHATEWQDDLISGASCKPEDNSACTNNEINICTKCGQKCMCDISPIVIRAQSKKEAILCKICNHSFVNTEKYQRHMKTHNVKEALQCLKCKLYFDGLKTLLRHNIEKHKNDKPSRNCPPPKLDFLQEETGDSIQKSQSDGKIYGCTYCKSTFYQPGAFKMHMLTHNRERPFACTTCSANFSQNAHLRRHMLTHSNVKPFRCKVCDSSFSRKDGLKIHEEIHTIVKSLQRNS